MKGAIKPDHMPVNKYDVRIMNFVTLTAVEVSGIEDELQTNELPDRTVVSGGNRGPTEFSIKIPMHHTVERAAMEAWYIECQDPVSPGYKKIANLVHKSISGQANATYTLNGVFIKKRTLPDLEMANEGEMATVEYMMSADDVLPL